MHRVTFAHLGESYRAFKMLMEDLGNEVIVPPRPSKKTIDLGVQYAPEFACFPLKIVLGTYLETLPQGADTIVTSGGVGPCRAGLYSVLHEQILKNMGYTFKMIVFEPPRLYPFKLIRDVKYLNSAKLSIRAIIEAIKRGWRKIQAFDNLEKATHRIRPRELKKGATSKIYRQAINWVDKAYTMKEIEEAEAEGLKALENIPQDKEKYVPKVGIVGEIYVLLEPASNLEMEELLGNLGVEVHRSMFLTGWTKDNTWDETDHTAYLKKLASPYLPELIGGHGRDSIGNTIVYAKKGFDGVIQLAPFTCIPEIVACTILKKVSKDYGIPVLTFFLDEQTGKAGMTTRLEAFAELMRRKELARMQVV